jgi:hypothetical protein
MNGVSLWSRRKNYWPFGLGETLWGYGRSQHVVQTWELLTIGVRRDIVGIWTESACGPEVWIVDHSGYERLVFLLGTSMESKFDYRRCYWELQAFPTWGNLAMGKLRSCPRKVPCTTEIKFCMKQFTNCNFLRASLAVVYTGLKKRSSAQYTNLTLHFQWIGDLLIYAG